MHPVLGHPEGIRTPRKGPINKFTNKRVRF
jgi:hypothetical protein